MRCDKRVLSIQSHVSYGYVGNRAATFPLQLLGWEVDAVNTVNFSNHAGYRNFGGTIVTPKDLQLMLNALKENGMMGQNYILTGYIPGAESLEIVKTYIAETKKNHQCTYLLDPVMGDDDRVYVNRDVIPVYKSMLKLADMITPNAFEVELLTDIKLSKKENVEKALHVLHFSYGVRYVVISSIAFGSEGELCTIISSTGPKNNVFTRILQYPMIEGYYSGVGDIFSALLLAYFESARSSTENLSGIDMLTQATEKTVASIQGVLSNTREYASKILPADIDVDIDNDKENRKRIIRQRARELRLVQSQDEIKHPNIKHKALNY
ncbi:Ribokinase-like protein [Wallemia mellicola CBS 633.66]|uniref:pyridoxal kinase n=1 Tax=Wallemia mellicola (strain ATCC MYA-4683 / CBS 633.66) TaxID=671144 RepID=I4YCW6_WALMC|nr:Ribokinase-like protein [Wallemia mellicola CBS 633.66]EIM21808.1 Ribokinase-like protein [Wallemia mellicola CBS 633.66]|eukprot:XP_006958112.1 Ribokinase-like protein [Wallemia mellicola CBS 633.66]